MTITQVEYFCSVCQCGNITEAAENNHVSQPAISMAIRELEKEFGFMLFLRKGKSLELTEQGRAFLQQCTALMETYRKTCAAGEDIGRANGILRVGISPMECAYYFNNIVPAFQNRYPDVKFELREGSNSVLFKWLDADNVDLIFTPLNDTPPEKYSFFPVEEESTVFSVRTDHDVFTGKKELTINEIGDYPLVTFPQVHASTQLLEKRFLEENVKMNVRFRTGQLYTFINYIRAGLGGGFLPLKIASAIPDSSFHMVKGFQKTTIAAVWKNQSYTLSSVEKMVSFLKKTT